MKIHDKGKLALPFRHWKEGSGLLVFDEETLKPLGVEKPVKRADVMPEEITKRRSDFPGMSVRIQGSSGPGPKGMYFIRWETLGSNRDRPRKGKLPENSELILYKVESE